MKSIKQAMIEEIQIIATDVARKENQTVGEKSDYYITLEQLEKILGRFLD